MSKCKEITNAIKRQSTLSYSSTDMQISEVSCISTDDGEVSSYVELSILRFWRQRRSLVGVLAFLGFCNVYALRVNLSVAIVAMTQDTIVNGTIIHTKEFDWDSKTKGLVLSSFFYGYLITQLPGGWLAAKYGGNKVFAFGVGATSVLTLLTPVAVRASIWLLVALRVAEGLVEGVTYPCVHAVWSKWAPPSERARLATLAFSGAYVGTVFSLPICSLLANALGWPSIFYLMGALGVGWTLLWISIVKESPEKDPYISTQELTYIKSSIGERSKSGGSAELVHPWKEILCCRPLWAIVVAHSAENWGFYTLLTFLPTYMKDVFKFELSSTGFASAIPYLAMAITLQVAGHLADFIQTKRYMSVTNIRKTFNCGGFIAQTVFMMCAAYSSSATSCIIFLTLAVGIGGFAWAGFSVNHLDIGGDHASILMGLSNTFATLPGIISPPLAGLIVTEKSQSQWRIVFTISATIYLIGAIIYGVWCSGERQSWAKSKTETNSREVHDNCTYEEEESQTKIN